MACADKVDTKRPDLSFLSIHLSPLSCLSPTLYGSSFSDSSTLDYLQQRTHQVTQTHFAYSTAKARGPTDDSNGEPILGEVQCGRQIWVTSLLRPKSVAQRHGGPVTQWHRRIGVMGLGFGLAVGERKI